MSSTNNRLDAMFALAVAASMIVAAMVIIGTNTEANAAPEKDIVLSGMNYSYVIQAQNSTSMPGYHYILVDVYITDLTEKDVPMTLQCFFLNASDGKVYQPCIDIRSICPDGLASKHSTELSLAFELPNGTMPKSIEYSYLSIHSYAEL